MGIHVKTALPCTVTFPKPAPLPGFAGPDNMAFHQVASYANQCPASRCLCFLPLPLSPHTVNHRVSSSLPPENHMNPPNCSCRSGNSDCSSGASIASSLIFSAISFQLLPPLVSSLTFLAYSPGHVFLPSLSPSLTHLRTPGISLPLRSPCCASSSS